MAKLELPLCFYPQWRKFCIAIALYKECQRNLLHPNFEHRACASSQLTVGPEGLTLHLVVEGKYFDAIKDGTKTVEYRNNTAYWHKRIFPRWNSNGGNIVIFHRGYTKEILVFRIKMLVFNGPLRRMFTMIKIGKLNMNVLENKRFFFVPTDGYYECPNCHVLCEIQTSYYGNYCEGPGFIRLIEEPCLFRCPSCLAIIRTLPLEEALLPMARWECIGNNVLSED